jgi:hypothetical protein
MLHILIFSLITSFSCIGAMEIEQHITSPSVASEICTQLIVKLYDQPLFEGTNPMTQKSKVLPLQDGDSRIVELLHKNIAHKMVNRSYVYHFSGLGCALYDAQDTVIPSGIMYCLYPREQSFDVSDGVIKLALLTGVFKRTCDEVIGDMQSGWKQSTLAENPKIFHTESENEWVLFIKPRKLIEEDFLMRFFCSAADMRAVARCHCKWSTSTVPESTNMLYLWIKKESFKEVVDKLGLKI